MCRKSNSLCQPRGRGRDLQWKFALGLGHLICWSAPPLPRRGGVGHIIDRCINLCTVLIILVSQTYWSTSIVCGLWWNSTNECQYRHREHETSTKQVLLRTVVLSSEFSHSGQGYCPLPWWLMTWLNFCNPVVYFSPKVSHSLLQPVSFATSAVRKDFSTHWLNCFCHSSWFSPSFL